MSNSQIHVITDRYSEPGQHGALVFRSSKLETEAHMKTRFFVLTVVFLAIWAASSWASPSFNLPPGKWWENPRLIEHIQLTTEQQTAIRELVYKHAERMIDLNADVERTKLALENEAAQQAFDAGRIRKAFVAFQDARRALELERFELLLSVRQQLTVEQWNKLLGLRERLEQMRHRRDRPGSGATRPNRRPLGGTR